MKTRYKNVISLIVGTLGIIVLIVTVIPILSYEWQAGIKYPNLISPLYATSENPFVFPGKDLTESQNWFDGENTEVVDNKKARYYTITIPKLKIENAIVRTDSEDLSQSLTQFSGSVRPGRIGNTVVFGHSILPIFYNPKNYISIFSTLYRLNSGDLITVNYDDQIFQYKVETMFEVRPTDIEVLEQGNAGAYLSLITCSPPGDPRKPKRLVVRAKLQE